MSLRLRGLSFSSEWGGQNPKYRPTGGHKFLKRKIGGHEIFDDQNDDHR